MKKCKLLAPILAASLLLSGCSAESFSDWVDQARSQFFHTLESLSQEAADETSPTEVTVAAEPVENQEGDYPAQVDFQSIVYTRPDAEDFAALVEECAQALGGKDRSAALEKCREVLAAYDRFYDMSTYAYIQFCKDLSDSKWQEEYAWCTANTTAVRQAMDRYYEAYDGSKIPGLGVADYDGHFTATGASISMTDELASLFDQEAALVNRYYDLLAASSEKDFYENYNEEIAELYIELIQLRKQIAEEAGYESYELFANHYYHDQDYTKEELETYIEGVKKYVSPVLSMWYHHVDGDFYKKDAATQDCKDYLASAVANMGGAPQTAWDYMIKYNLYDVAAGDTRYAGSYETYFMGLDIPFLFMSSEENPMDFLTFAHEFGHFFNDFAAHGSNATTNVAEFYSQAMEYLSLCYADAPDAALIGQLRQEKMADSLQTYVTQAVIYRFEQLAYALPEEKLTVEELNLQYGNVAREFNYRVFDWDPREWIGITHLFEYPFYTISYVLSNDAAIQIYQMELEEPGSGLALYCDLAKRWKAQSLQSFVEQSGLEQPLSEERLRSVARLMRDAITASPEE